MQKTILLTGATDGIGLETAKMLAAEGHSLLLHGRNSEKLQKVAKDIFAINPAVKLETFVADLSRMEDAVKLANEVLDQRKTLDVLINNAGVYNAPKAETEDGLDIRFAVNTIAPYLLTKRLLPILGPSGRVVNLSSAAQAPVNLRALAGQGHLSEGGAYAQSKLALTMWTTYMAGNSLGEGPMLVSVNPASLLGSKMVKQAFGVEGGDLRIGADILCRAALSQEFADASGKYYDNDGKCFANPHPDALSPEKNKDVVRVIETVLAELAP